MRASVAWEDPQRTGKSFPPTTGAGKPGDPAHERERERKAS